MVVSGVWESECSHLWLSMYNSFFLSRIISRTSLVLSPCSSSMLYLPVQPRFSFGVRHTCHFHLKQPNPHPVLRWHCVICQGRDCNLKNFGEVEEWEDLFILGIAHCSRGTRHSAVPECGAFSRWKYVLSLHLHKVCDWLNSGDWFCETSY